MRFRGRRCRLLALIALPATLIVFLFSKSRDIFETVNMPYEHFEFADVAFSLLPNGFLKRERSYCHFVWVEGFARTSCPDLVYRYAVQNPNQPYSSNPSVATVPDDPNLSTLDVVTDNAKPVEWITYLSACSEHSNRFVQVLHDSGIPLTVMGLGTRWRRQWGMRLRAYHDYLRTIPQNRLVIISDADDVLFVPGFTVKDIVRKFTALVKERNGPLIFFPAEVACFPRGDWWPNFTLPENVVNGKGTTSPFKYLNAGLIIGQAGHVLHMMELAYGGDCSDDQMHFSKSFLDPLVWWKDDSGMMHYASTKYPVDDTVIPPSAKPLIGLDHWNQLLAALYSVKMEDLEFDHSKRRFTMKATKHSPLILHQNGDKLHSALLEQIARELDVDFSQERIEEVENTLERERREEEERDAEKSGGSDTHRKDSEQKKDAESIL